MTKRSKNQSELHLAKNISITLLVRLQKFMHIYRVFTSFEYSFKSKLIIDVKPRHSLRFSK